MVGLHVDGIENEAGTLGDCELPELNTVTVDPVELLGDGTLWGAEIALRGVDGIVCGVRWLSCRGCELDGRTTVEASSASLLYRINDHITKSACMS